MTTPLVSVILPNYNYSHYLVSRIEGILHQTYSNIELILLDDKSTDNSAEILQNYTSNPKVSSIVLNDSNSGSPFRQWVKGISMAKGEYIWIAEADDEAVPEFLQKCVEALEANPSAALCYTASQHISSEGKIIPRRHSPPHTTGYSLYPGKQFAAKNLYWRCYIENASAVVFRRDVYERCDRETWLRMRSSGDWVFWFQMSMEGDILRIHEFLNRFRQHTCSVTAKAKKTGTGYVEDAMHIKYMESFLPHVSTYKHLMRVGHLYRMIRKAHLEQEQEKEIKRKVYDILHLSDKVRHIEAINRLFRWIPGTVTMKNDALPDTW